ncbi:hypothetical protein FVB9532_01113 [Mesonia oceanica]|uniref:Uncharacterized protein n=1 Tax=Mesonia oceanica TaxID=2687242 RepID=A0AC61Y630_9FLAO|nr:hypothetical protein FVB9532_01113 [Mesonia oceanica]|tara:strand:- start:182 stop:289 length:108 start_codon:yes stop_codon:yes gene_type:complete
MNKAQFTTSVTVAQIYNPKKTGIYTLFIVLTGIYI